MNNRQSVSVLAAVICWSKGSGGLIIFFQRKWPFFSSWDKHFKMTCSAGSFSQSVDGNVHARALFKNIASPEEQKKKTVTIDMASDVRNLGVWIHTRIKWGLEQLLEVWLGWAPTWWHFSLWQMPGLMELDWGWQLFALSSNPVKPYRVEFKENLPDKSLIFPLLSNEN